MSTLITARRLAVLAAMLLGLAAASPALAQADLVGEYRQQYHEDEGDPDIGDYGGLPINAAARRHAETWSASLWTVPEHQCIPHPADYLNFGHLTMWKDVDPLTEEVVVYHTNLSWMNPVRTIWMDGRPHPPKNALHTWEGFSTGRWEGDVLVVETTHLKPAYIRRNGLPRSADARLTEFFIRADDHLTVVSIVQDPAYLTEAYTKSRSFKLDPGYQNSLYPCSVDVEIARPDGEIPHYGNGMNPDQYEFAQKHHLPREAVNGGAETAYPEYLGRMREGFGANRGDAAPPRRREK